MCTLTISFLYTKYCSKAPKNIPYRCLRNDPLINRKIKPRGMLTRRAKSSLTASGAGPAKLDICRMNKSN